MANIFDQFDTAPTPSSPVRAAPSTPTAAPAVAGNPFDRFDPPKPAVPTVKDDLAGQFGAGIVKGIPNAVTDLSDLMEKGVADNLLLRNPETGRGTVETFVDAWGDLLSGKPATPLEPTKEGGYQPVSGGVIRAGLDATGLNPDKYFRPPETAGERIAELGGEGLVTAIFSPNKAQGWQKLVQAGKEMLIGAGAGAGAQAGMEVAPEWADPLVGLGAGLAAGVGTAGLVELPGAVARGVGRTARYVEPAVANRKGIERMAGEQLAATVGDRDATIAALGNADEIVPESRPTAFQATGDIGLGSLERALARGDDEFKRKLIERIEKQNEARVSALDAIQDSGNPALVADFFRGRMRELEDTANELYSVAEKRAKGDYEGLGERPAGEIGEQARTAIEGEFKRLNTEANKLWNSIDPDGTLVVGTKPLVDSAAKIYGAISPEEMLSVSAKEKALAGIIGTYDGAIPFKRFKDLRSEISGAMREAKMTGQGTTYGRLSRLRSAIEEAVSDSIAGKMEADPSLADDFVRKARDWYETRVGGEAGDVPAARPMAAAAGSARVVSEAPGEGSPASGLAAAPTRDQGLSEDARPVVAPEPIAPRPAPTAGVGIEGLDPADVAVDARRFQFKGGGDEAGVTERLQGIERWDPRLAGTAMVFRDATGKDWVADGHQRFGLARRLMDEGHPPIKVNSFVLDAADGYTDAQARAIAAVKNIAEGTGTPVDAAKVLRAAKASGIDLPPLPPRSALVKDGRALAQLSDEAFGAVVNEVIPHQQAAIIGRLVADPAQQMEAVRLLSTLKPDNLRQAELVIKDMLASGTEQMTRQGGLFGAEDYASSVTLERAKIADEALKLLRQDKRTFSTLVDEADRIENQGNVLSRASNEARLSTDERAADLLTQLAFRAGPVSSELSRIARQFKAGDLSASAGARAFLGTVREAVESGVDTGADAGGAGIGAQASRGEVDPDATPRDPDTAEMFQSAPPVGSAAFDRWFGDSKVVGPDGEPLVVYHGGPAGIESFDPARVGTAWDVGDEKGFFFTTGRGDFPGSADEYARRAQRNQGSGKIYAAYLRLENPYTLEQYASDLGTTTDALMYYAGDLQSPIYVFDEGRADITRSAERGGYDGIMFSHPDLPDEGLYVAFEPTQIKSVANRGTFDPNDPRILYQRERFGGFETEPGIEGKPQTLIPGVAPIDDATRIAAASSKPLKGGNAPPPKGGLFDDGEREFNARQMSLFQNGSDIRNTMAERFMGAGRPVEEAVAAGSLVDAFYTSMAQRLGKTVDEVQEQFPLPQVKKGGGEAGGLQQRGFHGSRTSGIKEFKPSDRGAFGPGVYVSAQPSVGKAYAGVDGRIYEVEYPDNMLNLSPQWVYNYNRAEVVAPINKLLSKLPDGKAKADFTQWWRDGDGKNMADVYDRLTRGAFTKEQVSDAAKSAGFKGIEGIADGHEAVIFDPKDTSIIREALPTEFNQARKPKPEPERNLYAVHNIKPGGVLNAAKIGGLPMPSLAVTRIDKGDFGNFGEISLVGSPDLIDPKGGGGAKTYDADVYSPRYPSVTRSIDEAEFSDLNRGIVKDVKAMGGESYDGIDLSKLEDRGPGDAIDSPGLKLAYLKEKGIAPKPAMKADGAPDWYANRTKIDDAVQKDRAAYEDWATAKLEPLVKRERIFKGFDYNGNRRYREHNIDNVLSDMRARLKEGEGFMYGVGTIRSKHAKKFGSIDAIRKDKDRITGTDQMKAAKDEFGDRFFALADEMRPYYRFDAKTFQYADDVAGMFGEMATKGYRALDEGFKDLPPELRTKISTYLSDLKNAPTEYFETKINRNVGLNEFQAALVPAGTAPRVIEALEKSGLKVIEYDKSKPNARTEAIKALNAERPADRQLLFQSESGPRGSIQFDPTGGASLIKLFEKADASTALHESAHQFLHMFRQFATAADAPPNITKDWSAAKAWWEKNAKDVAKDAGAGVTPEDVRKVLRDQSTGDRMKDLAIDKGLHEQWARGFEVYLREGKAPNAAMRGVFEQFKDWLTQVYQSITGMGVNLSPEIKAVFGRMLGGDGAQMIDDTAAGRFKAATAATRNIKDTFGAKPVKGIMRRPGPTYPYDMSPENVSAQIFKAGPEGAANIQNVMKAGATKDAIEAAAVLSAKRSASKEGAFDPAKFAAWRAKHTDALKQIPEIDQKLSSAASAAKTMIETGERNAKVIAEVRKTAIGKLLNVEAGADVAATIGSMLNRSDAVKAMRDLAKEAAKDPNALEGLRRAVVDHMLMRLKTPKDALRPDTFQRFLGKNAPALAQVLTPEQMSSLRAIAQDLKRASRDVRAPGGGSDTAENLAARGKYLHDKPSIIQTMIQQSIGSVATHVAASFFAPGLTNAMTWVAQTLGGTVLQSMRSAGIKRVDDLIKEAILDPELMKALLMKVPKAKNRGSALTLSQKLGNIAAMNLALGISHAQERDETGVERRRADQSAMSPMSGG